MEPLTSLAAVNTELQDFSAISGLHVNFSKTQNYLVNLSPELIHHITELYPTFGQPLIGPT